MQRVCLTVCYVHIELIMIVVVLTMMVDCWVTEGIAIFYLNENKVVICLLLKSERRT